LREWEGEELEREIIEETSEATGDDGDNGGEERLLRDEFHD
jgi:hypothetical protein